MVLCTHVGTSVKNFTVNARRVGGTIQDDRERPCESAGKSNRIDKVIILGGSSNKTTAASVKSIRNASCLLCVHVKQPQYRCFQTGNDFKTTCLRGSRGALLDVLG